MERRARLFRSGGSWAVRIPKAWVPESGRVVLRREGRRIIMTEEGENLRELARKFSADGQIEMKRAEQPFMPKRKKL